MSSEQDRRSAKMPGDEIKAARHALGLSQAALAARIGVPKRTLEDWETGTQAPGYLRRALLLEEMVERWRKRHAQLDADLASILAGQTTGENCVDDTDQTAQRIRANIAELDELLGLYEERLSPAT